MSDCELIIAFKNHCKSHRTYCDIPIYIISLDIYLSRDDISKLVISDSTASKHSAETGNGSVR